MKFSFVVISLIVCTVAVTAAAVPIDPNTQKLLQLRDSIMNWTATCDGQIKNNIYGVCDPEHGKDSQANGCLFGGEACYSSTVASAKYGGVACSGVRAQQDPTGRMWRNPIEAKMMKGYRGSFSRDESYGVILYIAATKDTELALKWRNYIYGTNGYTCPEIEDVANDCNLLLDMICNLNGALKQAKVPPLPVSMTHVLPRNWTSTWEAIIRWLKKHHWINETYAHLHPLMPAKFHAAAAGLDTEAALKKAFFFIAAEWERPASSSLDLCDFASLWMLAETTVNPLGYPLNLQSVAVMTRRILGMSDMLTEKAMQTIVRRQPENPYFRFLADPHSAENVANVTQRLLEIAPYKEPASPSDWGWQRPTSEKAWLHSCGWDFVFLINLVTQQP